LTARKRRADEPSARRATKAFAGIAVTDVLTVDGIKLNLEDGSWMLMRPSGTEPLVRIYMEARTKSRLKELQKAAAGLSG
jgi:phosphomannomutase